MLDCDTLSLRRLLFCSRAEKFSNPLETGKYERESELFDYYLKKVCTAEAIVEQSCSELVLNHSRMNSINTFS